MATPHIDAAHGAFAEVCLMPGDPLRAKFIADSYLEQVECVTSVRNMFGFTGYYQGRRVSVMGSGMGIPSSAIYYHELMAYYGVETIIRVGTCGATLGAVNLNDIIFAQGACTDSTFNRNRFGGLDYAAIANFELLQIATARAAEYTSQFHVGNIFTTDRFYDADPNLNTLFERYRLLGVDMESAGLYSIAAEHGKRALSILTVSDHLIRGEHASAEQRQVGYQTMLKIALDTCLEL